MGRDMKTTHQPVRVQRILFFPPRFLLAFEFPRRDSSPVRQPSSSFFRGFDGLGRVSNGPAAILSRGISVISVTGQSIVSVVSIVSSIAKYRQVSTRINTYQHVSTRINTYQNVSTRINTSQHVSTRLNTSQHVSTRLNQYTCIRIPTRQTSSASPYP